MSYLRQQVRCHPPPDCPWESIPTAASTRRSRRSRRSLPQGDDKLARMLTAGEMLLWQGADHDQKDDDKASPET